VAGPGRARAAHRRFFRGFYEAALEPGEIVTAVRVPPAPKGARTGYIKFTSASAEDRPLVGVAALIVLDEAGAAARHASASAASPRRRSAPAAPRPRFAESAERCRRPGGAETAAQSEPLSDLMGSATIARKMIRVWFAACSQRSATARDRGRSLHLPVLITGGVSAHTLAGHLDVDQYGLFSRVVRSTPRFSALEVLQRLDVSPRRL